MAKSKKLIFLEYSLFLIINFSIRVLPKFLQYLFIDTLIFLASYLVVSARKVVTINLKLALNLEGETLKKTIRNSYHELGRTALEIMTLSKKKIPEVVSKMTVHHFEIVPKLLERNKGLIICTAHYGSWELIGHYLAKQNIPVNVVYRPFDNPKLDTYFKDIRKGTGTNLIPRKSATKAGFEALARNEVFGLIYDQNASHGGVFVPFFGTVASTMRGPSFFAQKCQAPVICTYAHRNKKGGHDVYFSEEIPMGEDDIQNLTRINQYFEAVIKKDPSFYFWVHPRWKKRPPGEKSFYEGIRV